MHKKKSHNKNIPTIQVQTKFYIFFTYEDYNQGEIAASMETIIT